MSLESLQVPRKFLAEISSPIAQVWAPVVFGAYCGALRYAFDVGYCGYFEIPLWLIRFTIVQIVASSVLIGITIGAIGFLFKLLLLDLLGEISQPAQRRFATTVFALVVFGCPLIVATKLLWLLVVFALCVTFSLATGIEFSRGTKSPRDGLTYAALLLNICVAAIAFYLCAIGLGYSVLLRFLLATVIVASGVFAFILGMRARSLPDKNDSEHKTAVAKINVMAWILGMAILLIYPMTVSLAQGIHFASSKSKFLQVEGESNFVLLAVYGDNLFFREVIQEGEKKVLGQKFKLRSTSDIRDKALINATLGSFDRVASRTKETD